MIYKHISKLFSLLSKSQSVRDGGMQKYTHNQRVWKDNNCGFTNELISSTMTNMVYQRGQLL